MRKKLIPFFFIVLAVLMGGCEANDIDDLQKQINGLTEKVNELEETQQAALLAEIAKLQAALIDMENSLTGAIGDGDADLLARYQALFANLELLQEEVESNSAAVYYGNLLTDEDFAAFLAQEATIVTGKVIATSQSHIDAIAAMKMVGGDLTIAGGTTIELAALQNIGGNLYLAGISEVSATVKLPLLASVGDNVNIVNNSALVSLEAEALLLINGSLESMENPMLETLSFSSLDQVNEVYVNEYLPNDPNYIGLGSLTNLDLSSTNVLGNVEIQYISGGSLSIGSIEGDFYLGYTKLTELALASETIKGDFTFVYNGNLTSIDFSVIKSIEGNVTISNNATSWYDFGAPTGLTELPAFEALESIGGDVTVESNGYLTSLETFNSVTTFTGTIIKFSGNGNAGGGAWSVNNTNGDNELAYINVFNSLVDGGPSKYTKMDIYVWENTLWFNGFEALIEAKDITLNVSGILDSETWANGPTKIEGFNVMTACKSLKINATDAEAFTAYAALDNFKGYGVPNCLVLDMPKDLEVGMCSMANILNKIKNGDFDSKPAIFKQNWQEVEKEIAVDQLLAPCAI